MKPAIQMAPCCPDKTFKNRDRIIPTQYNFPILTLLIGLSALGITFSAQMTSLLQFDRTAIMQGEIWRIFTGHLTHWSLSHLIWDILVFLLLAGVIERFSRRRLLACFTSASLIISLLVFTFLPEMTFYRGLSGIDSALFVMLLVVFYHQRASGHSLLHKMPYYLLGILFIGKTVFELSTSHAFFVQSSDLFVPVPLAHLGGALVGWIIGALNCQGSRILKLKSEKPGQTPVITGAGRL